MKKQYKINFGIGIRKSSTEYNTSSGYLIVEADSIKNAESQFKKKLHEKAQAENYTIERITYGKPIEIRNDNKSK